MVNTFDSDKFINKLANSEFGESDPETRIRDYFKETASVQSFSSEGATVFFLSSQQAETNIDLADLVIPEEVERFNDLFASMLVQMQTEPEISMAEVVQRSIHGEVISLKDKAKQALVASFHASKKLMERVQAANLANGLASSRGASI